LKFLIQILVVLMDAGWTLEESVNHLFINQLPCQTGL